MKTDASRTDAQLRQQRRAGDDPVADAADLDESVIVAECVTIAAERADHPAADPRLGGRPVGAADRDRERVRGVVGNAASETPSRRSTMAATCCLVRRAVAADRLLHLVRRRLVDRDARLRRRQQRDAARLADGHRGLHVALEEEALDSHPLGPVLAR